MAAAPPASESGPGAGVTVMLLMSWAEGDAGREKGGDERFVSDDEGSDERRAPDVSWSRLADMASRVRRVSMEIRWRCSVGR